MDNNGYIARKESVGVGIEATPGTAVAPQHFLQHLSLDFQRRTTPLKNTSALGRIESVNDSVSDRVWADGSLEGKLGATGIGYLLYNIFGEVSTTDNADTDVTVKDHTFEFLQGSSCPPLTFTKISPVATRRHSLGVIDSLTISGESGDWVKVNAAIKARAGEDAVDTASYEVGETEFTAKHLEMKLATNIAGLAAASAIDARSVSLTIERPSEPYFPLGTVEPSSFDSGSLVVTGELVLRYKSSDYEDLWFENTKQALRISIVNTDVTIGDAANPGLVFTGPQARLTSFGTSTDLDQMVEQTIGFEYELSVADGYLLQAVLTNTQAGYLAA